MKIDIDVPDGISGDWSVRTFTVSKSDSDFTRIRAMMKGRGYVPQGTYKELRRNGTIVMSNTPDEINDGLSFVYRASGNILINGLGLGCVVKLLLNKPDVEKITIIEKSTDVISLVAPTYVTDKRVNIICADAFDYKPPKGEHYNIVWHDIWDYITPDNIDEMKKLHRKYGKISDFQMSWCRKECERANRY